ncbi:MAG: hypothetical protein U0L11_10470 [Acutalibacteraceae bacterium]|nr:hypothetical protein [Acutalibacteraceae bacterium]
MINITLLQEWQTKGCSELNIAREIQKLALSDGWTNIFCRDKEGGLISYTYSKKQMSDKMKNNKKQYVSTAYNEQMALGIIRYAVALYAEHIAVWMLNSDAPMCFLVAHNDGPIGTVYTDADKTVATRCTMITIKKSDLPCNNRSGFYVESLIPVPENVYE